MSALFFFFFFFNDTATTEIYTLSLHDALPISRLLVAADQNVIRGVQKNDLGVDAHRLQLSERAEEVVKEHTATDVQPQRSEEHTSELQSLAYLVCRLLLEKKKNK